MYVGRGQSRTIATPNPFCGICNISVNKICLNQMYVLFSAGDGLAAVAVWRHAFKKYVSKSNHKPLLYLAGAADEQNLKNSLKRSDTMS